MSKMQPKPITPWEEIKDWSRSALAEYPGGRLKRIMYGTETGAVPDDAFIRDCEAADRQPDQLRTDDPDDTGVVYKGLSFSAVAVGPSAEARARVEYYLCNALMDHAQRLGVSYVRHPVLDPEWWGRYQPDETGPAPVDSFTAAILARGAEAAARWDAEARATEE